MLKVKKLTKIYGKGQLSVEALKEVDFEVDEGEFISVMGPSGSGKSTLMNILGCLDRPTSGEYILDDVEIQSMTRRELAIVRNKQIGFVFQSYNLLPRLSALKNVELGMIYAGVPTEERRKRALDALEKVGLADRVKHRPNELSGGEKQRVAIARALANNPSIILADEPTGNLDSKSTAEILEIFKALNKDGRTIIIVTHEADVAGITKRKLTFKDGRLIRDEVVAS